MAGLRPQLHEHITTAEADLLTRALMPSLEPRIDRPPPDATFKWIKAPSRFASQVQGYVDGSRLYAEHELCGLVARQGWAIAAYDDNRQLVAAAHGRTPAWADGIHAAELWGLLMATQSFDPGCALKVDCLSVQQGSVRGIGWATAPGRKLARAWAPLVAALEGEPRVTWMPAHCSEDHLDGKLLGDGSKLTVPHVRGNQMVDTLAKQAAQRDKVPDGQIRMVRASVSRLQDIAKWLGRVTAYANNFPMHGHGSHTIRDNDGMKPRAVFQQAASRVQASNMHGDGSLGQGASIWQHPRLAALRARVLSKSAVEQPGASEGALGC